MTFNLLALRTKRKGSGKSAGGVPKGYVQLTVNPKPDNPGDKQKTTFRVAFHPDDLQKYGHEPSDDIILGAEEDGTHISILKRGATIGDRSKETCVINGANSSGRSPCISPRMDMDGIQLPRIEQLRIKICTDRNVLAFPIPEELQTIFMARKKAIQKSSDVVKLPERNRRSSVK